MASSACWLAVTALALIAPVIADEIITEIDLPTAPPARSCSNVLHTGHLQRALSSKIDQPVSIVVINWARPDNVRRMIAEYETYANVKEIIVLMSNPATKFAVTGNKTVAWDFSALEEDWSLTARFRACQMATSPHILLVDDDLIIHESGIQKLLQGKIDYPDRIIAFWGRYIDLDNPKYTLYLHGGQGEAVVALTRVMLLENRFCSAFFQLSCLVEHMASMHKVRWNGEDIFMSLVSAKLTGKVPWIVLPGKDDLTEIPDPPGTRIGVSNKKGHLPFRNLFLQTAIKRLAEVDVLA